MVFAYSVLYSETECYPNYKYATLDILQFIFEFVKYSGYTVSTPATIIAEVTPLIQLR